MRLEGDAGMSQMFVSYQGSIVIRNIRNKEFIEKHIPAHPSCHLDSLVALRNIYLLLFVIPDVTLVSNDNRPLKAHKHLETPCIPLQLL